MIDPFKPIRTLADRSLAAYADGLNWLHSLADMASGVDTELLNKSPWSEKYRYHSRGFLVVLVALVNGLACISALFLIIRPGSMDGTVWVYIYAAACILVGSAWALMIFNLYRFLVAAINPDDLDADWSLVTLLPQLAATLIFSFLLGFCMAVPVTVLISEHEIRSELTQDQVQLIASRHHLIDRLSASQMSDLYLDQVDAGLAFDATVARHKSLRKARDAMTLAIRAPQRAVEMDKEIEALRLEMEQLKASIDARLIEIADLRALVLKKKDAATQEVVGADTLWIEAGRALEHASGLFVGVALLLTILHASPALVRLFCSRGPYEHSVEIQNELVFARHGIAVDHTYLTDSLGRPKTVTDYGIANELREKTRIRLVMKQAELELRIQEQAKSAALRTQAQTSRFWLKERT